MGGLGLGLLREEEDRRPNLLPVWESSLSVGVVV